MDCETVSLEQPTLKIDFGILTVYTFRRSIDIKLNNIIRI